MLILFLLRIGWERIPVASVSAHAKSSTKLSVLIAARNEEKNIGETIECLLAQDYPHALTEIIIIDDHSTDGTAGIIASYAVRGVKLIQLNEQEALNSYKKKAISVGIERASGELIVATDADCVMGSKWLSTLVGLYEANDYKLISAPVVYFRDDNLFERLQTLEFLYLIGLGAAAIGLGRASTCNGANMAYKRDVFYELGGFKGIDTLASGDDELFLHKVAQKYPNDIGFCKAEEAIVFTEGKKTLSGFISQRRRWASKSTRYKNKGIVVLGVGIWLYNLGLVLLAVLSLFNFGLIKWAIVAFIFKIAGESFFVWPLARFAKRTQRMILMPLLSPLHTVYLLYIGLMGNMGKYQWKGRKVQ